MLDLGIPKIRYEDNQIWIRVTWLLHCHRRGWGVTQGRYDTWHMLESLFGDIRVQNCFRMKPLEHQHDTASAMSPSWNWILFAEVWKHHIKIIAYHLYLWNIVNTSESCVWTYVLSQLSHYRFANIQMSKNLKPPKRRFPSISYKLSPTWWLGPHIFEWDECASLLVCVRMLRLRQKLIVT